MSVQFKPVKASRIALSVTEELKKAILNGHFKGGEKLPPERVLSKQFEVSRTTIREALRTLENAGFIKTRLGVTGGVFVKELGSEPFINSFYDLFMAKKISHEEIYQVRLLIEPEAARLAALKITPAYGKKLRENVDNRRFHLILAEMSGNRFFRLLVKTSSDLILPFIEEANSEYEHPEGHSTILKAVLAGNSEAAEKAMRKHIIDNYKIFKRVKIPGVKSTFGT
ncbi:FadR family transcriptional regulator [bacterium]|nr:FadR family transcriptional regulator [bacterium]